MARDRFRGQLLWKARGGLALGFLASLVAIASVAESVASAQAQPRDGKPTVQPMVKPSGPEAEEHRGIDVPPLAPAVARLIDAEYLSEDEKRALRLKHGDWEKADLVKPADRAQAALIVGAFDDPALRDATVPVQDRAEATVARGELDEAIALLADDPSVRAARLRADAFMKLGRLTDADKALDALVDRLTKEQSANADELVEGVRGLMLRARLRGPAMSDGGDFKAMLALLGRAHEELDKLSWRALVIEATLLWEKDHLPDAGAALESALPLNPRSADAWLIAGVFSATSFDFKRAEAIAQRLDVLAGESLGVEEAAPAKTPPADPDVKAPETPEKDATNPAAPSNDEKPKVSPAPTIAAPPSLFGTIVRARMHLRENEGHKALDLLEPMLKRFPKQRDLLALKAAATAVAWDFAGADRLLAEYDAMTSAADAGSAAAWFEVGRAAADSRQYAEGSKYLNEAVKREPNWPAPWIELGLLEMQSGRDDEAFRALDTAAALDPFNVRVANSLTLVKELRTYASVESDHFIVRYKGGVDDVLAKDMLPALERIYIRVTGNGPGGIDYKPMDHGFGKTVIELMPDHHWFAVRITGMSRIHTIAAATGPVVAMEAPRDGPGHLVGPYDWQRVVQHEYTHTVTLARTRNRLPHWFTEAAAVYLEDRPRDWKVVQMLNSAFEENQLFDMDGINLGFIRPKRPADRPLAYAQSHWMYEFIVEKFGAKKPLELMDLYATGEREEGAFRKALGVGREEFLSQFKVWAKEQLIAWGMVLPEGVPSVRDLLKESALVDPGSAPTKPTEALVSGWLERYPKHPEALRLAIKFQLEKQADKPDASMIPLLERYAEARPFDTLPRKLLAKLYLDAAAGEQPPSESSRPNAAIPHLEFLDITEQNSTAYAMELSRLYAARGEWDKATAKAERAVGIAPYDASVREFAATIALRHEDFKTAERHIQALTVLEPDRTVHQRRLEAIRKKMGG